MQSGESPNPDVATVGAPFVTHTLVAVLAGSALILIGGVLAGELIRHVGVAGVLLLWFAGWVGGRAAAIICKNAPSWLGWTLVASCVNSFRNGRVKSV